MSSGGGGSSDSSQSSASSPGCTVSRAHVGNMMTFPNPIIVGVEAKITTRIPFLCAEGTNSQQAASSRAYVNVSISIDVGLSVWVQGGYVKIRPNGQKDIKQQVYLEISSPRVVMYLDPMPADGVQQIYNLTFVDPVAGLWRLTYGDEVLPAYISNALWKNNLGIEIEYMAERYNEEDTIPGTTDKRCSFNNCVYFVASTPDPQATRFGAGTALNEDPVSFGLDNKAADAFDVWQKG